MEHEEPTGNVAAGFARALDDSNASRSRVIANLNEVVRRNGHLLNGAEDLTTGKQIEGVPLIDANNVQNVPANVVPSTVFPISGSESVGKQVA